MLPSWLQPPRFSDVDKTRNAGVLHWILLSTLAAVAVGIFASPAVYPEPSLPWLLYAIVLIVIVPSMIAVRRGHVRGAASIFLGVAWLVTAYGALHYGGARAPAALGFPVLVLMAGFLHSVRAALLVALVTVVFALAMLLSEAAGQLPPPPEEMGPQRYWLALNIVLLMTAALVTLALRNIQAALSDARRSERRFAEMVEASPDGMVSVNADGTVESINPAAEKIAALPASEIVGRPFLELGLIPPQDLSWAEQTMPRALAGEFEGPEELGVLRRDGTCVPIEVRLSRVTRPDGGVSLQATMRDLSERRRAEEERAELEARLLQAQKLEGIGRLAGGVAHDFNNYLTVILGNLDMLTARLARQEQVADLIEGIEGSAERSAELTRQLLAFSSKQIFQPRVLDLNGLVAHMEPMLRRILGEDVELDTVYGDALGRVRADPAQIETALLNLVVNARDAMPRGGGLTIETRNVSIEPDRAVATPGVASGRFVLLAVRDTGEGMDEETRERIFEPFFTTKGRQGTGLGLSSVYGIVTQSGGGIEVDSAVGSGSRFEIYLPRIEEEIDSEAPGALEPLPDRSQGTILLVEDEEMVRAMATSVLRSRGYRVLTAANGNEALEAVEREGSAIDLVVTDLVMPRMSGAELAEHLRESHPELLILFVSGYTDVGLLPVGALDGDIELLQKPFNADALSRRVHRMLEAR